MQLRHILLSPTWKLPFRPSIASAVHSPRPARLFQSMEKQLARLKARRKSDDQSRCLVIFNHYEGDGFALGILEPSHPTLRHDSYLIHLSPPAALCRPRHSSFDSDWLDSFGSEKIADRDPLFS